MANNLKYAQRYENSWGLVVGINAYTNAPPLGYACNDAKAIADRLVDKFGFPSDQVALLLDDKATLAAIRRAIAKLVNDTRENDRVIIFYAGHGHTIRGNRREAGYLVPVAGDSSDTATLLPWDELVAVGNVIRAKHLLYIMDACYGGLISTRKLSPGSTRIARDMLTRYSRQYLTAGKADQEVADGGGPRTGHSMFTGNLLDALDGAVTSADGLITANSAIAYVYDRVAKDPHSIQTPHYGWIDGDGDLFFTDPKLDIDSDNKADTPNLLISVPSDLEAPDDLVSPPILEQVKEYLADRRHRIQLNDLITRQLRKTQQRLGEDRFPLTGLQLNGETFASRLRDYEMSMDDLLRIAALLCRWADEDQQPVIRQLVNILAGQIELKGGSVLYLGLRSFPMLLTMYVGGIAAIEGDNYRSLYTLFTSPVEDHRNGGSRPVLEATVEAILDVDRTEAFKLIPEFSQKYAARSEYFFTRIQPIVEDVLTLGTRYERLFDRFEILYALSYADLTDKNWGPPGRFAWKHSSRGGVGGPFLELINEAQRNGDDWGPLRAGLFRKSFTRFNEVAERYKILVAKLGWW